MNRSVEYLKNLRSLLQIEYEEEKNSYAATVSRAGLDRLAERGDAWLEVSFTRTWYNSLNNRIAELRRNPADDTDGDNNFEYGKPVAVFSRVDSSDGVKLLFTATVSLVEEDRMTLIIPENADISRLYGKEGLGVMISFDETTYRLMFEALDRVIAAGGTLGKMRDFLHSGRAAEEFSFPPVSVPYLNKTQQKAVDKVLRAKEVAIVHGPPGTGKTTTLVEAIYETLRRESQVLVCAQSNMAVDWISEKLMDRGISVLRIGNPSRVDDKMLSFTYERRFEDHPDYPALWSIRKDIRQLRGAKGRTDQWHQKMDRLQSRATELELRINNDIFNSVSVISCTLAGSGSRLLDGMKFHTLFIDEAAQALEPACWIAMRRAARVVLAGDHCQLPPTVKSLRAMKGGLARSLMERIVDTHPEAVTLLSMQYRMNEKIMEFSNSWFYGGHMTAAPEVRNRGILDFDTPIEWIDTQVIIDQQQQSKAGFQPAPASEESSILLSETETAFRESSVGANHGRINEDEALFSVVVLQNYIERIGVQRVIDENIDFGLISPYRAQVNYMRHVIKCTPFFRKLRNRISINTVDGFQGQERDVILISLVRSNDEGNIGFLRDLRRMNVAMTRARMKLIIIGRVSTLSSNPFYLRLHQSL